MHHKQRYGHSSQSHSFNIPEKKFNVIKSNIRRNYDQQHTNLLDFGGLLFVENLILTQNSSRSSMSLASLHLHS